MTNTMAKHQYRSIIDIMRQACESASMYFKPEWFNPCAGVFREGVGNG